MLLNGSDVSTKKTMRLSKDGDGDGERLTGIRSAYFCRMRSASALRFSNGCSSLNLERMFAVWILDCYEDEVVWHSV